MVYIPPKTSIEALQLQQAYLYKQQQAAIEAQQAQYKKEAEQYNGQQAETNRLLQQFADSKDVIHTVNITSSQIRRKGSDVIRYYGTTDAGGRYANEYISGDFLVGHGNLDDKALASARSKFGINENDRVYIDGRLVQESSLAPEVFNLARQISSGQLSYEQAQVEALRTRREELKRGYKGSFSDIALQDVITPVGGYLPSYVMKLPQYKAEEMIKEGKIGGWQVGGRYFRTEQEANVFIKQAQAGKAFQAQAETRKVVSPYAPGYRNVPQWEKDFSPEAQGYKPYVTIEGTTVYTKAGQAAATIIHPKYGKMIPVEEYWQKYPTPLMKAGKEFESYDNQLSDALKLRVNVIKPLEQWYEKGKGSLEIMGIKSEPRTKRITEEFISGAAYGIAEKPLTVAGNIALAILVTRGTGALVSKAPFLAQGIGKGKVLRNINIVNTLGAGLAASYGIIVGERIITAPSPARKAGEIVSTELIPFAAGAYLGTKPFPKLPYTITRPKGGVLVETKGVYTVPETEVITPNKALTIMESLPAKEGWVTFASKTKGGLTDIYIRPPKKEIPNLLEMLEGKGEYVKTKYGSYFKITPEGKVSASTLKQIRGKSGSGVIQKIADKIPYKISRRIDIEPARLKFIEQTERLGLTARTYDYDIVSDILRPGKGTMRKEPYGGMVKGAPAREQIKGIKEYLRLTAPTQRPLLRPELTKEPAQFKSLFDAKSSELADYTRNIFRSTGLKVATVTTVAPQRAPPIITMPRIKTEIRPEVQFQVAEKLIEKKKLQAMDKVDTKIKEIEKIFERKAPAPKTRALKIERKVPYPKTKPSARSFIYNLFKDKGILAKGTAAPKISGLPKGFIRPSLAPSLIPSPIPGPSPRVTPSQAPKTSPKTSIQPSPKPKPAPSTKQRIQIPKKPTKLTLFKFKKQIKELARKKKKKGIYIWDIENPVPTLKELVG